MSARIVCAGARVALGALCAALGAAPAGCHSFSTMTTARTLGRGHWELYAAPEASAAVSATGFHVVPAFEAGGRYGVTDRVDVGARLWSAGAAVRTNVQLLRAPTANAGFDIAVGPSLGWSFPNKLTLDVPLLFGWNVGGGSQFVLAPRLSYQLWFGPTGQAARPFNFLFAGASLGFAWRVVPWLTVLPEVAFLVPVASEAGVGSIAGDGVALQGGVGFLFGR